MKKLIILLLCVGFTANTLAATNTSATKTQKKAHHHKAKKTKKKSKQASHKTATDSSDPILDAVSVGTTTSHTKSRAARSSSSVATHRMPKLYSYSAYVINAENNSIITSKNPDATLPIASISKLMMAMVLLDSGANLDDYVTITADDIDTLKNTFSRLKVGMQLRRRDLLLLALMSSENRAAHALGRTAYAGGINVFVQKMNAKAKALGMTHTKFYDPTGLTSANVSSADDVAKMVKAAYGYELIREDSTTKGADVMLSPRYTHRYINSDALVRAGKYQIELSKTGFINEAGHCLTIYTIVEGKPYIMVFLNSAGKNGRILDAMAMRNYIARSN